MQMPVAAPFDRDAEHLKLLSIFHYVVGGLTIAFSSLFVLHLGMMLMMYRHPEMMPRPPNGPDGPPREFFLAAACMIGGFIVTGWILGIVTIISGRLIANRKARPFSLILAGIMCMNFPFGTALGVCTLIVLSRNSVREQYEAATTG